MNIGTALNVGYTIANVISFLTGNYPKLGKKIKEAQKLGYDVEKIVKTFSSMTTEQIERFENSKELDSGNPWISASETQREGSAAIKGKEYLKKGAKIAGAVAIPLAAYGLQRYLNKGVYPSEILQGDPELPAPDEQLQLEQLPPESSIATPPTPPSEPSPIQPTPIPTQDADIIPQGVSPQTPGQQIGQGIQAPITQALQPSSPTQIAQASQALPDQMQQQPEAMMPQQTPQQIPIFEQLLGGIDPSTLEPAKQEQIKFLSQISDQLQSKGKKITDPEFIKLGKKIKDIVKGKPGMLVEETARFNAGQETKQANVKPLDMQEMQEPKKVTITKNEIVSSPKGIGTVLGTSNGSAIIDINGKKHKVSESELQPEPEEVKKSVFDFDPQSIPEELRSAPLNEVYLPHDRRHITVKYNQGLNPVRYIYFRKDSKNIPIDFINKIVKGTQLPISSGLNFWGAWDASSSDSRGSASYEELTRNSQEEGSPDDPTKDYWFIKEESIYTHPYQEKVNEALRAKEKEFNEKNKKPKKTSTRKRQ